jgi:SMODS-associated and fused to various effectors sensor domain/HNH endonuclease
MTNAEQRARHLIAKEGAGTSPVFTVKRSDLKQNVRLLLFVRAGGRCQFDGCNRYLLEHAPTLREGNFAEIAHIVAFQEDGPRGTAERANTKINSIENLMLLCPPCHKLVDDHPGEYSRPTLEKYKHEHEERIRHVTGLAAGRKTTPVVLKSRIGGQDVAVPFEHIVAAVAPRYPLRRLPFLIDLTAFDDAAAGFMALASEEIKRRAARLYEPGAEAAQTGHLSVFALAPIPLLIFLGTQLSNKVPADVFQRHRDTEDWTWKQASKGVQYELRTLRCGTNRSDVALAIEASGSVGTDRLPESIDESYSVYAITPIGESPCPTLLRSRFDLENFRLAYQSALAFVLANHGLLKFVDFFPVVPAPIAVLCGRELTSKGSSWTACL